jgi:hypothetical protein
MVYRLAERGLLAPTRSGHRLAHVALTPAGRLLADTLAADPTPNAE